MSWLRLALFGNVSVPAQGIEARFGQLGHLTTKGEALLSGDYEHFPVYISMPLLSLITIVTMIICPMTC